MSENISNVPFAISAGSSEELSALMFENNIKHGKAFAYHIVVKGNKFYAWYYSEVDEVVAMQKALDAIPKADE